MSATAWCFTIAIAMEFIFFAWASKTWHATLGKRVAMIVGCVCLFPAWLLIAFGLSAMVEAFSPADVEGPALVSSPPNPAMPTIQPLLSDLHDPKAEIYFAACDQAADTEVFRPVPTAENLIKNSAENAPDEYEAQTIRDYVSTNPRQAEAIANWILTFPNDAQWVAWGFRESDPETRLLYFSMVLGDEGAKQFVAAQTQPFPASHNDASDDDGN